MTLNVCSPLNAAEYLFKDISCFNNSVSHLGGPNEQFGTMTNCPGGCGGITLA